MSRSYHSLLRQHRQGPHQLGIRILGVVRKGLILTISQLGLGLAVGGGALALVVRDPFHGGDVG